MTFDGCCTAPDITNEHTGLCGNPMPCLAHHEPAPGVYDGIEVDAYHSGPGVSRSTLWTLRHYTPAHLRVALDHPHPPTPDLAFGRAVHHLVLEPDTFSTHFVRDPFPGSYSKQANEERARLEENGKTIVQCAKRGAAFWDRDDWRRCAEIAEAVHAHPVARVLFGHGKAEQSLYWRDPETGLLCKARPDWLDLDAHACMLDVKTCRDASGEHLWRDVDHYGYHVQAAWCLKGAAALELSVQRFVFLFVEKAPPYGIRLVTLPQAKLDQGARMARHFLRLYAECQHFDEWPGYSPAIEELEFPPWSYR